MAGGNIKVVVRVRPFNSREKERNAKCIVQMKDTQTILTPPSEASTKGGKAAVAEGKKVFAFDRSYWSFDKNDPNYAGQEDLFSDLGVPLLDNAFQGYNNCIFAYGQTGAGKSYSMMGYGKEYGVIPMICQHMFERIGEIQKDKNIGCTVEVSYLEIYNERVRDLLNPSTKGNLKVREHPSTGPYVEDLAKLVVRSFEEIDNLMDEGNKARTVAATNMNETSSRSHAVFTLTLTQKRHDVETSLATEKVAKISLVDLAGSERATSTGATGARLKEGAEINRSLSTLGRVIAALADLSTGKKKGSQVPYRDSVLTWLLKDSLGGNSMTAMIAAISPADINFDETLGTLRYADSAKRIKNHAVVNEDPNARMIRELKEELAQLRSKLSGGGGGGGATGAGAEEQYAPDTPLDKQIVSIAQADGSVKKVSKAEIVEQLNQSEKLYEDLNQTWEEKLQKTEEIQKEREAALEELGISIEKGFVGLSTPKKMPHLVNLSDDPLLAGCLVYNLKPGKTTVGNPEGSDTTTEIRINGTKILRDHCAFENVDGVVTVIPSEGAAVMINGVRIDKPQRLRNGNRLILGDFHIFRFNHPQEAKSERAEQGHSSLRYSVTASQIGSPFARPGHDRTLSTASDLGADRSRSESPFPPTTGLDWSFARREAAGAILGVDQKIDHLTDEALDSLFEDVQKARVRRGRPESRLFGTEDDESESVSSYPIREKYLSNGTIDNFSLDTALTIPSTPQIEGDDGNHAADEKLQEVRREMQAQLDKQREEYQEQLRLAEASSHSVAEIREAKQRMEEDLQAAKEELQDQLRRQKEDFEAQIQEMLRSAPDSIDRSKFRLWTHVEKRRAAHVIERWRQLRNFAMAEVMLKRASLLKEAQVMCQLMDKDVKFQFTIVDQGQDVSSSYDVVLNGINSDDDEALFSTNKPCVSVRVMDYQHLIIHLWSLDKLERRVQEMRQMQQYHDKPDYMQHFNLQNPFIEAFLPQYSLVGDAQVPLTAVFEARVQDYAVHVISSFTQQSVGVIRVSLEPSSAEAPASMLKFNVVMHDLIGFAEREGTEVHAQLFVPGISDESGVTTTQMISGFDEGAIRFESVHSMSVPQDSPRRASLQIAIFAKVTSMHLDKLLSWDEMREAGEKPVRPSKRPAVRRARISERHYIVSQQHDVFAKVQILEMSETGDYQAVEVEQHSNLGAGTFQLHQGLQRRIVLHMTHTSAEPLLWEGICSVRIGNLRLVDISGKVDQTNAPVIPLKFIHMPDIREDAGGTTHITIVGQWDSSMHDSSLLDRPTADQYSVLLTLTCGATCKRTESILTFHMDQTVVIKPRAWIRPQTMFKQLWRSIRVVHSTTSIFSIELIPVASKRTEDLWRLSSHHQYVKGEEDLEHWAPRGISLIKDYMAAHRRRQRITEVEAAKAVLARLAPPSPILTDDLSDPDADLTSEQQALLNRTLALWSQPLRVPSFAPLHTLTTPPRSPARSSPPRHQPRLHPTITSHPKNPLVIKSGALLLPSPSGGWLRRHAELRPPYLHIFSLPESEELQIINLRNATVDAEPEVGRLMRSERVGAENVFAVYGTGMSWLFAVRNEHIKAEWILALDRAFMGAGGGKAEWT